jgi:replication factor A1
MSNKKFTSIKNDYAIRFNEATEIELVADDPKISYHGYQFMTIKQFSKLKDVCTVDVIAVVLQVHDLTSITIRDGTARAKRALTIADDTDTQI